MSGYDANGQPLAPHLMMEDIVGDYTEKTVTLEDFPFFSSTVKMASVHPCKHAPVMKTLLDRADAALKLRREKQKAAQAKTGKTGVDALASQVNKLDVRDVDNVDDWEEVQPDSEDQEVAIRVDQYLVVFLKVCFCFKRPIECVCTANEKCHSSLRASPLASSMTTRWHFKIVNSCIYSFSGLFFGTGLSRQGGIPDISSQLEGPPEFSWFRHRDTDMGLRHSDKQLRGWQ